ncbi:MAG: DUF134 domain-containing protein [Acidobacteria bacterium]|nr:DUF134 domain-containing protein [Acidobacteriota bacterium]
MGRKKILRKVDSVVKGRKILLSESVNSSKFVTLSCDELEALRLCDLNGLYQSEAATKMEISRATFARILFEARRKIAKALIDGSFVKMSMGNVKFENEKMKCPIHKTRTRRGRLCLCKRKERKYDGNKH